MIDAAASKSAAEHGCQLLADFVVAGPPEENRQLPDRLLDAVQGLNLQPLQLERIHEALVQAVARTRRGGGPTTVDRLRIRVWVMGTCASARGWGFFLLEKGDDNDRGHTNTDRLVELFLYQECDS